MAQKDLIPVTMRSKEEAKALSKKGGINSGKTRRRQKEMREWAKIIGSMSAKVVGPDGKELKGATLDADVVMQQYRQAHKGNVKAAYFIAQLTGQLEEKVAISSDQPIVVVRNAEEKQKIDNLDKLGI